MQPILEALNIRQKELIEDVIIGNWLAVIGRCLELIIGVMLALVLVRLNDLCRRRQDHA